MAVSQRYAEEIHTELKYLATWMPNVRVKVGDIGTVEDGIFTKTGTLEDYGIAFSEDVPRHSTDMGYSTAGAVSIKFKAAGNAPVTGAIPAKVDGDVEVTFDRADAILFQASNCKTHELANIKQVSDRIISLFNEGQWPKNQVIITDVVHSAASTIVISSDAKAQLILGVKGDVGSGKTQLASVNANFTFKDAKAIATKFIADKEFDSAVQGSRHQNAVASLERSNPGPEGRGRPDARRVGSSPTPGSEPGWRTRRVTRLGYAPGTNVGSRSRNLLGNFRVRARGPDSVRLPGTRR